MLSGLLKPTEGQILVEGKEVEMESPRDAKKLGIGMVHQHFMLIPAFTVLENIILGEEPLKGGRIDYKKASQEIERLAEKYQLDIDLKAKVADITVGMQQRVEIMKALYRKANIFIFDEPTKGIDVGAKSEIYDIMRGMADQGKAIIMVSSEMPELLSTCDRIIVFRNGEISGILNNEEATEEKIMYAAVAVD